MTLDSRGHIGTNQFRFLVFSVLRALLIIIFELLALIKNLSYKCAWSRLG